MEGSTGAYGPAEAGPDASDTVLTASDPRAEFGHLLRRMVHQLEVAGKTVALVYPIPEIGRKVPQYLAEKVLKGTDPASAILSAWESSRRKIHPCIMDDLPIRRF